MRKQGRAAQQITGKAAGAANKVTHQGCLQPCCTISTRKHEQGSQQQQQQQQQ
jgi:hypothetical protein